MCYENRSKEFGVFILLLLLLLFIMLYCYFVCICFVCGKQLICILIKVEFVYKIDEWTMGVEY